MTRRLLFAALVMALSLFGFEKVDAASYLDGKVIINEWGQLSAGDYVEILVTQTADLRGLWVCDSGGPDAANGLQLSTTNTLWASVPAGTLIAFYDATAAPAEDFNNADYNLVMNVGTFTHPELFDPVNNHFKAFSSGTATDNPRLFDKDLALVQDWDQNDNAAFTGALRASASGEADAYTGNTPGGVSSAANWSKVSGGGTPGQPNGGANTTWIQSLRPAPPPDPLIAVAPATLNFGDIDPAATTSATLTITNHGAANTLTIYTSTTLSGTNPSKFSIITGLPLSIPAGTSTTLRLGFNPSGTTGTLSAVLNIASNDSSSVITTVTLTGTATSHTSNSSLQGKVIINEWGQDAGGDWLEILVTETADLRGMWVCDSGGPDAANGLQFNTTNTLWSSVRAGTLITIYDIGVAPVEDLDASDFTIVMGADSPSAALLFDPVNNHFKAFSGSTATDNPRLFDSNKVLLHDWDQNDNAAFIGSLRATLSGDTDVYNGNTAVGVTIAANWSLSVPTPGQPNGGANTTWIQSLRLGPPPPNAVHDWAMYQ